MAALFGFPTFLGKDSSSKQTLDALLAFEVQMSVTGSPSRPWITAHEVAVSLNER